jgi:hypothetical protein
MHKPQTPRTDTFGPFVMLPCDFIDYLMPALLESEWRVLLVILRQTRGWVAAEGYAGRKERDWISMGQFAQKTGLHRDSIGRAVEGLVRLGLIRVESEEGKLLDTPALRKRYGARLYYRLTNRYETTPGE